MTKHIDRLERWCDYNNRRMTETGIFVTVGVSHLGFTINFTKMSDNKAIRSCSTMRNISFDMFCIYTTEKLFEMTDEGLRDIALQYVQILNEEKRKQSHGISPN